jgi:hypothetical protein
MSIDEMLSEDVLAWVANESAFRGLWKSRLLKEDGSVEEGWGVTFVFGGDYTETEYQSTALGAVIQARKLLAKLRDNKD